MVGYINYISGFLYPLSYFMQNGNFILLYITLTMSARPQMTHTTQRNQFGQTSHTNTPFPDTGICTIPLFCPPNGHFSIFRAQNLISNPPGLSFSICLMIHENFLSFCKMRVNVSSLSRFFSPNGHFSIFRTQKLISNPP